jgi:hypothetical protein
MHIQKCPMKFKNDPKNVNSTQHLTYTPKGMSTRPKQRNMSRQVLKSTQVRRIRLNNKEIAQTIS